MPKKFLVLILVLIIVGISVFVGVNTHNSKEKEFNFNDSLRLYRIHLPKDYQVDNSYPLVVALHGVGDNPRLMEMYTGLSRKADEEGFIVLYPSGTKPKKFSPITWNAEICCGYSQEKQIDDIGFIESLINSVSEEYKVDRSRIYIAGYSNGGMLAHLLSLRMGNKIAATGVVAGAVGSQLEEDEEITFFQKSEVPVPIIILHGRE
ncbi:alpha/beta hydrolase family esterase, partial [Patescibacteria group bacterium]